MSWTLNSKTPTTRAAQPLATSDRSNTRKREETRTRRDHAGRFWLAFLFFAFGPALMAPNLLLLRTSSSILLLVLLAQPWTSRAAGRVMYPPEEESAFTKCLTRSRYLCPVAPVVPAAIRDELTNMPQDELRSLCGKLEDGKKTFFAGDSLTLQIHNELICLCGVKVKRKSVFVNLKGLSGTTVAQTFRKEVIGGGLRRGDRVVANFGSWYNRHQSSNWRKYSPQMGNLATEMRAARMRGAKLTWTTTVSQHFCTKGGVWGEKRMQKPEDDDHANGTTCCDLSKLGQRPAKDRILVERSRLINRLSPHINVVDFFNITTHLWKAHPGYTSGGRVNDCTHYCTNFGGAVHYMSVLLLRSL